MVGAIDWAVSRSIDQANLVPWVQTIDYLPHHEAIRLQNRSQVLLLLINDTPNAKGILTGKIFEYMNASRPILAIGPVNGEVGQVLRETKTGHIIDYNDKEAMKKQILEYYARYKEGNLAVTPTKIDMYSRRNLTAKMADMFNEMLEVK
jgi:hypothetical protein